MIVETEAYLGPHDLAAHARHGKTKRNAPIFGPIGHAYVYLIYGIHDCFNVVSGEEGAGSAILIRALHPVANCLGRTNGPGLLTRALAVTRAVNGHDLVSDDLFIAPRHAAVAPRVGSTRRVGVEYAGRWAARRLRYYVRGDPYVSRL
jgi:DNA-3-methyladenine glycosylase